MLYQSLRSKSIAAVYDPEDAIASWLGTRVDDSADRYAGSRKNSNCTFVDVLPALMAVEGNIRGASVRHGVVRAA